MLAPEGRQECLHLKTGKNVFTEDRQECLHLKTGKTFAPMQTDITDCSNAQRKILAPTNHSEMLTAVNRAEW
jgi:hypothetical protein